jgi:hypothetical protein
MNHPEEVKALMLGESQKAELVTESSIQQEQDEVAICRNCEGTGIEGYATADMATDAGDSQLQGQPVRCRFCHGGTR